MKYLLAAGCSHTAGSEIDGTEDSEYNRQNSFAGILAEKLDRKLINIASHGSSNPTIARSVLEWFDENYKGDMDVFTLVGWAESSRMEIPTPHTNDYVLLHRSSQKYRQTIITHYVSQFQRPGEQVL